MVALGADVVAVDTDPAMLTELHHALRTVRALSGSAEAVRPRTRPSMPYWPAEGLVGSILPGFPGNAMHWLAWTSRDPK